jgi:hypothetical protein
MDILTAHQQATIDKDKKVFDMYYELCAKGVKKTAAMDAIKNKYGIYTYRTIYNILIREADRRKKM